MSKDFDDALKSERSSFFISPNLFTVHKECEDFLGKGSFGTVYRCYHGEHGKVAVKTFRLQGSRDCIDNVVNDLKKEMDIMLLLQNSSQVVKMHGFTEVRHCMVGLVMEYLPRGSLSDLVQSAKRKQYLTISWPLMLRIMHETAAGLAYLHQVRFDERITHNDLKPENILLDAEFHAKLCDFGGSNLAACTSLRKAPATQRAVSDVYTTNYVAPEYLTDEFMARTRAMDVYSYGMIVYFALAKTTPFSKLDCTVMISNAKQGMRPSLKLRQIYESAKTEDDRAIIDVLSQTMEDCWEAVPEKRPKISVVEVDLKVKLDEVGDHRVANAVERLSEDLPVNKESDPSQRIDLSEKCEKDFVPKLRIPYDDEEVQPLISPKSEQSPWACGKATNSQAYGFYQHFPPDSYEERAEPKLRQEQNPKLKTMFKATCSTSGHAIGQSAAVVQATDIDITHTAIELRKGDKIYIKTKSKLAECVVKNTSSWD